MSRNARWSAGVVLSVLLLLLGAGPAGAARSPTRADGHVLIAWLHGGARFPDAELLDGLAGASVAAPSWWRLDTRRPGGLSDQGSPEVAAALHERGLAVWPVVSNRDDDALSETALRRPARRARLVRETVAAADRVGADGVIVRFDELSPETAGYLPLYVAELTAALGDRPVAATTPVVAEPWRRDMTGAGADLRRRALVGAADLLVLQAIDQHRLGGPPGPVAARDWVDRLLRDVLTGLPAHRVVLGVPLYTREWVSGSEGSEPSPPIGMDEAAAPDDGGALRDTFDERVGQQRSHAADADGQRRWAWREDPRSLANRAALVGQHGLAGLAGWHAGFAGPEAWHTLADVLARTPPPGRLRLSGPPRLLPEVPRPHVAGPEPPPGAETAPPRPTTPYLRGLGAPTPVEQLDAADRSGPPLLWPGAVTGLAAALALLVVWRRRRPAPTEAAEQARVNAPR